MTEVLNVYFKNKLAGYLSYNNGELSFQYDEKYLANKMQQQGVFKKKK